MMENHLLVIVVEYQLRVMIMSLHLVIGVQIGGVGAEARAVRVTELPATLIIINSS